MSHGEFTGPETSDAPLSTLRGPEESVSSSSLTTSERNGSSSGIQQPTRVGEEQTNTSSEDG